MHGLDAYGLIWGMESLCFADPPKTGDYLFLATNNIMSIPPAQSASLCPPSIHAGQLQRVDAFAVTRREGKVHQVHDTWGQFGVNFKRLLTASTYSCSLYQSVSYLFSCRTWPDYNYNTIGPNQLAAI